MAKKWTDEQLKAIDTKNRNILVSAAAGSGKTAVLVERIINMITGENSTDIDRLVVVTFTKAAAAEMKARIRNRLDDMLDNNEADTNLLKQIALINNALLFIFLIHFLSAKQSEESGNKKKSAKTN